MAKIRFGYSDDFTAKNSGVGINTTDPQENLDVDGVVKGQDLKVTGISSQTGYEGFLRADHQIEEETQLNFGQGINASLSGEIIVGTGKTVTVTENLKEDRFGPELITNGQFLFNVDDWTAYTSSNSFSNGRLRITRSGGVGYATYQIITSLVPGATYFASAIVDSIGSRGDFRIVNGDSWGSNYYFIGSGTNGQVKTLSGSFTATGTTALVGFAIDDNGTIIEVDQVTVRRVNDVEEPGTNVAGGSQIECMKVYNTFTPPSGGTNQRPSKPKPGQLYYNYDFKTIEFHDGYGWRQVDNTTRSGRMVVGGGVTPGFTNVMQLININTLGNSVHFGDLFNSRGNISSCSSSVRGIWAGGASNNYQNGIEYVTIASSGNALDFGDLSTGNRAYIGATSSSTRGIFGGGYQSHPLSLSTVNIIDYIEMSTTGNALDFGDLFTGRYSAGAVSNGVRAVWGGGNTPNRSVIDFVNIAAKGNAVFFGDLTAARRNCAGGSFSNNVRGCFSGGQTPAFLNVIDYITIASEGNAVDFGSLSTIRARPASSSTNTRGVMAGGLNPSVLNSIEYVNITSTGDAQDFGDLYLATGTPDGCSDSHGGLGGF